MAAQGCKCTCPSAPPERTCSASLQTAIAVTPPWCASLITYSSLPDWGPNARILPSDHPERIALPAQQQLRLYRCGHLFDTHACASHWSCPSVLLPLHAAAQTNRATLWPMRRAMRCNAHGWAGHRDRPNRSRVWIREQPWQSQLLAQEVLGGLTGRRPDDCWRFRSVIESAGHRMGWDGMGWDGMGWETVVGEDDAVAR